MTRQPAPVRRADGSHEGPGTQLGHPDDRFVHGLGLIEREAGDGRHLVDKAVGMALRAIGKRRSSLTVAAISVAERLAASEVAAARRIGRPALNELRRSTPA